MKQQIFFFIGFILNCSLIFAQNPYIEHTIIDSNGTTEEPRCVFTADLDGDGDLDVLTASDTDNKIAWHENFDGLGNFGVQQVIEDNADQANIVYAADLDNDGDIDVLSGSEADNIIAWYENIDGTENFGEKQIITNQAGFVKSIHVNDLDNDGDMDVLSASSWDDEVAWYENLDGQGTFGTKQIISSFGNAYFVFSTDIDNDGDIDVIAAFHNEGKIYWYENIDGQGNFGGPHNISETATDVNTIYSVDIDNDGDMDVVSSSEANVISWYENTDGLGTFGLEQIIISDFIYPKSVHAADFDNDGDMDILAGSYSMQKVSWFENLNGQGSFGPENIISSSAERVEDVYAADLNGDGNIDVLSASSYESKVSWFENLDGNGNFGELNEISRNQSSFSTYDVMAADLDGDGLIDVVASDHWDDHVSWYKNIDGNGNFSPQKVIYENAEEFGNIYLCDIDGDSDMDILYTSYADDEVGWLENIDGDGNFQVHIISPSVGGPISVYSIDLDGDGDLDVLSGYFNYSPKVVWFENMDGQGTFSTEKVITDNANWVISVYANDIDGDGDMDVISSSAEDQKLAWYENQDGQGNFGPQQIIALNTTNWFIQADDLDGDGDVDILASTNFHNSLIWYENTDGLGNFDITHTISTQHDYLNSGQIIDFDQDGDNDVLVASSGDGKISWYENLSGVGEFGSQQIINSLDSARSAYASDINGDGILDVVAGAGGKISWYQNSSTLSISDYILSKFILYPNPTEGILNIKANVPIIRLIIYNELGQEILNLTNNNAINSIDLTNIPIGLYFIHLQDKSGNFMSKKILKK